MKRIFIISVIFLLAYVNYAQPANDFKKRFIAVSEQEMYKLLEQMIDSTLLTKIKIEKRGGGAAGNDEFEAYFSYFDKIQNQDTIIMFVQNCGYPLYDNASECDNSYFPHISECMPIAFYERFLNYLKELRKSENYYKKRYSFDPLNSIKEILIKQYESGQLNEKDRDRALELIEEIALTTIKEEHSYEFIRWNYDKYMTDNIRKALVEAIENPYYPSIFWDSYKVLLDTFCVDTTGIPAAVKVRYKKVGVKEEAHYYRRLNKFYWYREMGEYKYGGLSAGQAYLKEKEENYFIKGYSHIESIAMYAYEKNDKLLIKHIEDFVKKHPDYKWSELKNGKP